ncbi:MAG: MFS transporter, partial [Planctomycetota bacterium]
MSDSMPHPIDGNRRLFWGCFIALVATSFAFILRIMIMDDLAQAFNLSETERGEILGVGIWPFGVSIVLFSLIIDRIGYGKAILFAFFAHSGFALLTIFANGYAMLYFASFLGGLAAGAIEAAINPIVATMFKKDKTKWLNILHAGWPAGLMLAGVLAISFSENGVLSGMTDGAIGWQTRIALIFIPVVVYGAVLKTCHFPVTERVAAGVSYKDMLKEAGFFGALITSAMILLEVGRVFVWNDYLTWGLVAGLTIASGLYLQSPGRPFFIILMLIMMPLAITELGTDSWITELMEPEMTKAEFHPVWVLVYTATLMMILRFVAGPIVHKLSPLGLLAVSAALAIVGLYALSSATGVMILVAATVYGLGKTFFWPTMLGLASEQSPRGGALTLNMLGGIGMLAAGVLGNPLLGNIQDQEVSRLLLAKDAMIHQQVIGESKLSLFGR